MLTWRMRGNGKKIEDVSLVIGDIVVISAQRTVE